MKENTFEQLMELLSKSVSLLEGGELQLEKAMEEYQKGLKIIKILNERLETAKQQLEVVDPNE
ncbi:MAG: exodeoxyribonuclease VII small subunit [Clostridiales bacterium]|nr:exodeoxyribonuclease VII small subunit [Clostridiales bacterium]